jgi:hypothetical protein
MYWNFHIGKAALQKVLLHKKYNEEFYHPNIHPDYFKKYQKPPQVCLESTGIIEKIYLYFHNAGSIMVYDSRP